jgi:glucan biosynthesis protein C
MEQRRLYYIDWLRVLAVLLLFPFHTGRVFNVEAFYVKGPDLSSMVNRVLGFIDLWHMPLLFVLAGASTYLALGRRRRGEYAGERVKRLLVPLVFGILVLIPPQTWCGARFNSGYQGSYLRYLASDAFFHIDFREGGDYFGGLGVGHLWFILFLFVISLAALPLWAGRGREGSRLVILSRFLAHPGTWPLAGLAILLGEALPDIGGKNIFYYFVFFALGYLAVCSEEFMAAARRWTWLAFSLGVAGAVGWTAIITWLEGLPDPSMTLVAVTLAGRTVCWMLIVGLLGLGSRVLNTPSAALTYLAEGSYPVYLLHQTVIVVLAFYLVGLDLPWAGQWAILLVASVAATFLVYAGVRRVAWLRFLFGMRPLRREPRGVLSSPPRQRGRCPEGAEGEVAPSPAARHGDGLG